MSGKQLGARDKAVTFIAGCRGVRANWWGRSVATGIAGASRGGPLRNAARASKPVSGPLALINGSGISSPIVGIRYDSIDITG